MTLLRFIGRKFLFVSIRFVAVKSNPTFNVFYRFKIRFKKICFALIFVNYFLNRIKKKKNLQAYFWTAYKENWRKLIQFITTLMPFKAELKVLNAAFQFLRRFRFIKVVEWSFVVNLLLLTPPWRRLRHTHTAHQAITSCVNFKKTFILLSKHQKSVSGAIKMKDTIMVGGSNVKADV